MNHIILRQTPWKSQKIMLSIHLVFFFCASSCQTQVPLAALTARAHQLKEYMEKLEEQLSSSDILSQIPARTVLLVPPVPLSRPGTGDSANWPLCLG